MPESGIITRIEGRVGRITLTRPEARNAMTHDACRAVIAHLHDWAGDDSVAMVLIDAVGDHFCAGGDIARLYATGTAGDFSYGRAFWRDAYRMTAALHGFPKPVASFLQGYVLGGGVGLGCHASHRIVCDSARIGLPESSIGLVPDVGSTLILGQAPGRLGEYLGVTGDRMDAGDAIHCGFADYHIPRALWPALTEALVATGDWALIDAAAHPAPASRLATWQAEIDTAFGGETLGDIYRGLPETPGPALTHALGLMGRNAPLAMACAVEIIHRVRIRPTLETALGQEYRFAFRAMEQGDILEGIRAALIDKDRRPVWRHADWRALGVMDVPRMLMPLGAEALTLA
jgi:enoyl-CoA hydratase